jgi:hypothetical protein
MEMEDYGYPPVFPAEEVVSTENSQPESEAVIKDKSKAKKVSKLTEVFNLYHMIFDLMYQLFS